MKRRSFLSSLATVFGISAVPVLAGKAEKKPMNIIIGPTCPIAADGATPRGDGLLVYRNTNPKATEEELRKLKPLELVVAYDAREGWVEMLKTRPVKVIVNGKRKIVHATIHPLGGAFERYRIYDNWAVLRPLSWKDEIKKMIAEHRSNGSIHKFPFPVQYSEIAKRLPT